MSMRRFLPSVIGKQPLGDVERIDLFAARSLPVTHHKLISHRPDEWQLP
jgi:hypothetical protein